MLIVWGTLAVGLLALAGGVVAILKTDRRWRTAVLYCCRCTHSWVGKDVYCNQCQGKGRTSRPPEHKIPTHDWQGHMDTGPIPVVRADAFSE